MANVIGSNSKKRYVKTIGDNGRTYTDEDGNSYNDSQFKAKEGDYTEEATGPRGKYVTTNRPVEQGGGGTTSYEADKYSQAPAASQDQGLGALAKKIGMNQDNSTPDTEDVKKKKKKLEGMP